MNSFFSHYNCLDVSSPISWCKLKVSIGNLLPNWVFLLLLTNISFNYVMRNEEGYGFRGGNEDY